MENKMKLVSMKEVKDESQDTILSDAKMPEYPYGLRINIDADEMEKLGLTELPEIGKKFMVHAMADVVSISQSDSAEGEPEKNFSLQITDMALEKSNEEQKNKDSQGKEFSGGGIQADRFYAETGI
jgi:hypothetical protein